MEKIVLNLFWNSLMFYLGAISTISGQSNLTAIPYNIDIKKNIKNIQSINLSTIGSEIAYIPLETTPKCLIKSINKIIFSDSCIFVSEINKLLQFDKRGKFVRQIGSAGTGPEEYLDIRDFCIDEKKHEIYVIPMSRSQLLIYDFDGVFINSFNLSFRASQIIPTNQSNLMYYLPNIPGKNDLSWIITNKQGIIVTSVNNNLKRIRQPGNEILIILHSPLYMYGNHAHFMEFGIDTLYYFQDSHKLPYAIFSYGDLKMEVDPLITSSMIKNRQWLTDKIYISSIIENNDFMFINFIRGITSSIICGIYNKKTGTFTFLKENIFVNDLSVGVPFWPKHIKDDKILIDYIDAFDLLKIPLPSDLRGKITESSNPVLIIVK